VIAGSSLLADTMTLIWYVLAPEKLSAPARDALLAEVDAARPILVSAYSIVELVYLVEKGALTAAEFDEVRKVLDDPDGPFVVTPVTYDGARLVSSIPRVICAPGSAQIENNDPGDRIIAATAVDLGLQLVTSDKKLRALPSTITDLDVLW
jgi:PIN domain nuclease of toxin-antitoxin system